MLADLVESGDEAAGIARQVEGRQERQANLAAVGVPTQDQVDVFVELFVGKGRNMRQEQVEALRIDFLLQICSDDRG